MTIIETLQELDLVSFLIGAALIILAVASLKLFRTIKPKNKDKPTLPQFKRLVKETNEYLLFANENLLKLQTAFETLEEE